jgi:hypothetical protein
MAAPTGPTQTITATVEAVNERGIKIHGGWLNVSKFHAIALPMRGALVALEVQGGRWIQRCDVLDGQDAHRAPQRAVAAPGGRDAMIARQVALKAAVAYCSAREAAKAADILPLAASFEAWLTRPLGEEGGNGTPTT